MSMSAKVKDFVWKKGENDLEYIEVLVKTLAYEKSVTDKAIAKIKELTKELNEMKGDYERGYENGVSACRSAMSEYLSSEHWISNGGA